MNYFFLALYRGLEIVSNGGRGSQEYNLFLQANFYLVLVFVLARGRKNGQGGLFSCEVHAAHAVSAFQTKLSTASSFNLQLVCDRLCY